MANQYKKHLHLVFSSKDKLDRLVKGKRIYLQKDGFKCAVVFNKKPEVDFRLLNQIKETRGRLSELLKKAGKRGVGRPRNVVFEGNEVNGVSKKRSYRRRRRSECPICGKITRCVKLHIRKKHNAEGSVKSSPSSGFGFSVPQGGKND